jgi:hypothetical protein
MAKLAGLLTVTASAATVFVPIIGFLLQITAANLSDIGRSLAGLFIRAAETDVLAVPRSVLLALENSPANPSGRA